MGLLVLYQQVLIRLHASLNTLHRENCGKLIVDQVGGPGAKCSPADLGECVPNWHLIGGGCSRSLGLNSHWTPDSTLRW